MDFPAASRKQLDSVRLALQRLVQASTLRLVVSLSAFLDELDRISLPAGLAEDRKRVLLRERVRVLLARYRVADLVASESRRLGEEIADCIEDARAESFQQSRDSVLKKLAAAGLVGLLLSYDRDRAQDTVRKAQSKFSKIAIDNLRRGKLSGKKQAVDFARAFCSAESKEDAIKAIMRKYGYAHQWQAERVWRTEHTRAVGLGQYRTQQELERQGVRTTRTWFCMFKNSRHWHESMHLQTVSGTHTPFISGQGTALLYPGDPSAPASEVCNCQCLIEVNIAD